jgi:hypothetical protein
VRGLGEGEGGPRALAPAHTSPTHKHYHTTRRSNRTFSLLALASSYLLRHFDAVVETAGWLRLPRTLVAALLSSDDLATTCEVRLLQAAILWALANQSPAASSSAGAPAADAGPRAAVHIPSAPSATAAVEAAAAYRAALEHTGAASAGADLHGTPADALLPPLPAPLLREVRALLVDVCPSLRLAQMPLHVLRSATLAGLVPAELTLPAVFHKLNLEQEHTGAALMGSHRPPSLALNQGWAPSPAAQQGKKARK